MVSLKVQSQIISLYDYVVKKVYLSQVSQHWDVARILSTAAFVA